jgi:L-ascorbate metabolism protein UlaG (beta-lactamase superfamily)
MLASWFRFEGGWFIAERYKCSDSRASDFDTRPCGAAAARPRSATAVAGRGRFAAFVSRSLVFLSLAVAGCASVPHVATARSPLTLTYFGVAGWSITDGTHTVLTDPYFSRPADPFHSPPDEQAVAAHAPAHADVIIVGHAHVDHGLDAPLIAKKTGAVLVGTAELAEQARAQGLTADKMRVVTGGEELSFDGFSIRVVPSLHSRVGAENGEDVQTFAYDVHIAGHEVLVFDTANFVEPVLAGLHPDVVMVAPGLRENVPDYACRLMKGLGLPPLVLATHFDAWREPPQTPLTEETKQDLAAFADELQRCSPNTEVKVPTPFEPFAVP